MSAHSKTKKISKTKPCPFCKAKGNGKGAWDCGSTRIGDKFSRSMHCEKISGTNKSPEQLEAMKSRVSKDLPSWFSEVSDEVYGDA